MAKKKRKTPPPFADKGLYEREPEPTPEERARRDAVEQFEISFERIKEMDFLPFRSTPHKIEMVKAAHPLLAALEAAETPADRKAAQDAIDADGLASEIQRRLARFEAADAKAFETDGFVAGFEFAAAYLLAAAGADARHGKRMSPKKATKAAANARAERGRKGRTVNPLKAAALDAWEDYREEAGPDATKTDFAENWLMAEGDAYNIEFDDAAGLFRRGDSEAAPDTVRRWLP